MSLPNIGYTDSPARTGLAIALGGGEVPDM
jgi:hypothetical protein